MWLSLADTLTSRIFSSILWLTESLGSRILQSKFSDWSLRSRISQSKCFDWVNHSVQLAPKQYRWIFSSFISAYISHKVLTFRLVCLVLKFLLLFYKILHFFFNHFVWLWFNPKEKVSKGISPGASRNNYQLTIRHLTNPIMFMGEFREHGLIRTLFTMHLWT